MSKPDEYKKIRDSFETGYEAISNKEIIHRLKYHSGTTTQDILKSELTRRLIDEIEEFNKSSSKQTKKMIILSWVIVGLTTVLGVLTLIQLIILLN